MMIPVRLEIEHISQDPKLRVACLLPQTELNITTYYCRDIY